jgi:hypothetical protein
LLPVLEEFFDHPEDDGEQGTQDRTVPEQLRVWLLGNLLFDPAA